MVKPVTFIAGCLSALFLAAVARASIEDFADSSKVNVLMRVDGTGVPLTTTAWANASGGGPSGAPDYVLDAGTWAAQWNYPSQSATNYVQIRVTLAAPETIATLKHLYQSHRAIQYRISGSLTGFGSMTELVPWTAVAASDGPYVDTIASTTVQYLQFEFEGTQTSQYLLVQEIEAYPPAGETISVFGGYNLFYQDARRGPITEFTGSWHDNVNNCIDLNIGSYLRAHTTPEHSLTIPLNGLYRLVGGYAGFYHGQVWAGGVTIEVTDSATTAGASWTQVYAKASNWGSGATPFGAEYPARFIRLNAFETGGNSGALCEFRVFAVAPPCQNCDAFLAQVTDGICGIETASAAAWKAAAEALITDTVVDNLCTGSELDCEAAIRAIVLAPDACAVIESILDP